MLNYWLGNGTEDIVRKYKDPSRLLLFSVHLFDREEAAGMPGNDFFPGSGMQDDLV